MHARRLRIHGRVQGVYYRLSMVTEAGRLAARGWVRNREDGTVEAHVEGPPAVVAALEAWAARGPSAARVDRVDAVDVEIEGGEGFEQRPAV